MNDDDVPRWAKKARLRFDRHAEKWMILYPERGLALNEEGALIARKIDGARSVKTIIGELEQEVGAPRAALEKDVGTFLDDLKKKRIIEV